MSLFDGIMSPLGKEHCTIYYLLGVLMFFFAVISLVTGLLNLFDKKSRQQGYLFLVNSVTMFFTYYLYRIIHSICIKTL